MRADASLPAGRARRALSWLLGALAAGALVTAPAAACTTFCLRDGGRILFGKNYDWHVAAGMVMVNQRGVAKAGLAAGEGSPARWTSRHGSVTFNQYGREFPSGGMNEAGLVIELMWLDGTRYPDPGPRPALGCLQWIQYQLDTAGSVEEVLASDAEVRIASRTPLHYLVADASGRAAAVEFLDGRLVAHTGENLPVAALANHTYRESLEHFRGHDHEERCLATGPSSLARFARAADRVRSFRSTGTRTDVEEAFRTLDGVAQQGSTQWSIVYEIDRGRLHYRTARNRAVRTLHLGGLAFGCGGPVQAADIHRGEEGDAGSLLEPLSHAANLALVRASHRRTRHLGKVPEEALRLLAEYPATTRCAR